MIFFDYTYGVYQIFTGDLATLNEGTENVKTVLTNIQWSTDVDIDADQFQSDILAALGIFDTVETDAFTAEYVASKLTEGNMAAFAKAVADYRGTAVATFTYKEKHSYTANVSEAGYYLILNPKLPEAGAYATYIPEVADAVTIAHKADTTVAPPSSGTTLKLKKTDVTFGRRGVYITLELENGIAPEDVKWSSSDSSIASVYNGIVTAIGKGVCTSRAEYNGQVAECMVHCKF